MDASVEVNYPVDVIGSISVSKLVGSDGVVVKEVTDSRGKDLDLVRIPLNGRYSSVSSEKDITNSVKISDELSVRKFVASECSRLNDQLPHVQGEDLSQKLPSRDSDLSEPPRFEELQRKLGRISRSGSSCSKRARITQVEQSSGIACVDETKDLSDKEDKTQLTKQRNVGCKRNDKRSCKSSAKNKFDSFSTKASSSGSGLSGGNNNILGLYGLKLDINDVTKLVEDLSLSEVLAGTVKCPSLGKDKVKKVTNTNENVMQAVRKVSSLLQSSRPNKSLNCSETDNSSKKLCPAFSSSISFEDSIINGDREDPCAADFSTSNEETCRMLEKRVSPLDLPLHPPKDLLERLALPSPKHLDSLLLDATRPSLSSRSDPRLGKHIARRGSLPTFSWSHASNGHSRTSSDGTKLSMGKTTCQGRWVKIVTPADLFSNPSDCFSDLDSISYNESLVPSGNNHRAAVSTMPMKEPGGVSWPGCSLSTLATYAFASDASLETRGAKKDLDHEGSSPSELVAAQTLCDLAALSARDVSVEMKWLKKGPHKACKVRKGNVCNMPEEKPKQRTSLPSGCSNRFQNIDHVLPPKKPKISTMDNCFAKAPISWSAPRSSRSSPSRPVREYMMDTKHPITTSIIRQPFMMPPPPRTLEKACIGHQKPRKPMSTDWKGRDRHF